MDIKKIMTWIIQLVLVGIIFIAIFYAFQNVEVGGNKGILPIIGNTSIDTETVTNDTESYEAITEIQNTDYPEVKYNGSSIRVSGVEFDFRDLVLVKPAGSTEFVVGSTENGFSVELTDIMDSNGVSIMAESTKGAEDSDEIYAPVYFNINAGTIVFNQMGEYRMAVKVTGINGRTTYCDIRVPVEVE